ncbi:hypothetical protein M5689_022852 [Euphorbia peplus]|nr:hypothetical protein M5689_022852 [Euphorbia peplus]
MQAVGLLGHNSCRLRLKAEAGMHTQVVGLSVIRDTSSCALRRTSNHNCFSLSPNCRTPGSSVTLQVPLYEGPPIIIATVSNLNFCLCFTYACRDFFSTSVQHSLVCRYPKETAHVFQV